MTTGTGEYRYESEHVPPCPNCHIERTFPDANTQWEMGGRAAMHYIKFCPLHSSAPELLEALKDLLPFAERYCSEKGINANMHLKLAYSAISKAEGRQ